MKLFSHKKAKKAKVVSARKARPAKEATEMAVPAKKAKVVSAMVVSAKVVSAKKARPAKEAAEKSVSAKVVTAKKARPAEEATEKASELVVELPPEAAVVGGDLADPVCALATVTLETGELSPVFPPTAVMLRRLPTRSSLSGRSKFSKQVSTDILATLLQPTLS